jgi:hypothetical protein
LSSFSLLLCVAIFNESTQELSIEPVGVPGQLACLTVDQKGIGCCPDKIPSEILRMSAHGSWLKTEWFFLPE